MRCAIMNHRNQPINLEDNMKSVKVITPQNKENRRTAAVFLDDDLYVVHFRNDGTRTRNTENKPYEYRTKDEYQAIATARDFVKAGN